MKRVGVFFLFSFVCALLFGQGEDDSDFTAGRVSFEQVKDNIIYRVFGGFYGVDSMFFGMTNREISIYDPRHGMVIIAVHVDSSDVEKLFEKRVSRRGVRSGSATFMGSECYFDDKSYYGHKLQSAEFCKI